VQEHVVSLESSGAEVRHVRRPEHLEGLGGIVLPGGESTTMSKLLEFQGLMEPLRDAIANGFPAYGSCAGMILLSRQVLDGRDDQRTLDGIDMTVRRNAFGSQVDSFELDLQMPSLGNEDFPAIFIRAPWVEHVGPAVEVLASVPGSGADRIVAVRQGACLATSFHPELTGDARVHRYFLEIVRQS
jgi:pyridoxal 5'-phosphate synthase pdxT subunit